jgi:hypothetical protein
VSSVCGTADGFTKCGLRFWSFKDKLTGQQITVNPYWGFSFDLATSTATFDPTQAAAISVITAALTL